MWMNIDSWVVDLFAGWRDPVIGQMMVFLSKTVDYGLWFLIVIYFIVKKKPYGFCYISTLIVGSLFYQYVLKPLFHRPRPCHVIPANSYLIACPIDYSFPSGHTTMSFIAATLLYAYDKKAGIIAYLVAFLIALSRLYLGVHYLSDILGGIVFGIVIAGLGIRIMKIHEK